MRLSTGDMTITPQLVLEAKAELGEGPRWNAEEQKLYWVDIDRHELHRFDPSTGVDEHRQFDEPIGCFAFRRGGGLILAMKYGFSTIDTWDSAPRSFGDPRILNHVDLRFNDGRTDSSGNFWVGSVNTTKSARDATLYKLAPNGVCESIEGGMYTCNGAAFSPDGTRFTHADTPTHALRIYDVAGGALTNRRILHQFPMGQGRPDGGTFDEDGQYWSALFDGGRVVKIAPDGQIVETVHLPVSRPTMVVFGGADRRTAYVTSARVGLDAAALAAQPLAGGLFSFRVDTPGMVEYCFG